MPTSAEPMADKQARFSHPRILESNDARVVVLWRYAPVSVHYDLVNVDPLTGWGDWVEETYTVYPDGTCVRKIKVWSSNPRVDPAEGKGLEQFPPVPRGHHHQSARHAPRGQHQDRRADPGQHEGRDPHLLLGRRAARREGRLRRGNAGDVCTGSATWTRPDHQWLTRPGRRQHPPGQPEGPLQPLRRRRPEERGHRLLCRGDHPGAVDLPLVEPLARLPADPLERPLGARPRPGLAQLPGPHPILAALRGDGGRRDDAHAERPDRQAGRRPSAPGQVLALAAPDGGRRATVSPPKASIRPNGPSSSPGRSRPGRPGSRSAPAPRRTRPPSIRSSGSAAGMRRSPASRSTARPAPLGKDVRAGLIPGLEGDDLVLWIRGEWTSRRPDLDLRARRPRRRERPDEALAYGSSRPRPGWRSGQGRFGGRTVRGQGIRRPPGPPHGKDRRQRGRLPGRLDTRLGPGLPAGT